MHNPINEEADEINNKRVEETCITQLTPNDEGLSLQKTFTGYVMMYPKRNNLTSSMVPFSDRIHGPKWFTKKFPPLSKDHEAESMAIWDAFLTPKLVLIRLRPSKNQLILLIYQPNLVSRQFSLN